jgi:hypothetical protein
MIVVYRSNKKARLDTGSIAYHAFFTGGVSSFFCDNSSSISGAFFHTGYPHFSGLDPGGAKAYTQAHE